MGPGPIGPGGWPIPTPGSLGPIGPGPGPGPGGSPIATFPPPDPYRGAFRDAEGWAGHAAASVDVAIAGLRERGLEPAIVMIDPGFISDGVFSPPEGYLRDVVRLLDTTGAANVGGMMRVEGETSFGKAVAAAMSSPLGIGGSKFHVGGEPGPARTVYLGAFRRDDCLEHLAPRILRPGESRHHAGLLRRMHQAADREREKKRHRACGSQPRVRLAEQQAARSCHDTRADRVRQGAMAAAAAKGVGMW